MLKKAGFVVAAAAASLLAVSPMAFAGDEGWGDHGHGHGGGHGGGIDKDSHALVGGVNGNNVNVPVQVCNNNPNVAGVQAENLTAALGVLGPAKGASSSPDSCGQTGTSGDAG